MVNGRIILEPKCFSTNEPQILQRRLDALKSECGCRLGAVAVLLSMAAYVCYLFSIPAGMYSGRHRAVVGISVFFASAVVGKAFGILLAKYKFITLTKKLAAKG